ncbi:hypothetical protein ASPVEDRAFT_42875 [Aspergillus versicolor CBS 583.65]|uniref:Histone chaperone domain-containing protein n=1 Tax=Aspergillus versicolor CBS 583.65 TaxID=1036611 RepID=A0A1L9PPH6_ASPVE|nr:uncharacterized protein ASPVEDRAFT_42875 [Aspergillus versicolor CBS 583.65]OJJ03362.1 hypothetical protein ASPVEDRAFT_42875 [Aspergillus versicolor CBS 583.65]
MSNRAEREAEDRYENLNDPSAVSSRFTDNSYAKETRSGLKGQVPVQRDSASYNDPMQPPYSNTDQQLAQDENEAIDRSNILGGDRLRHAKPDLQGQYREGEDEEEFQDSY